MSPLGYQRGEGDHGYAVLRQDDSDGVMVVDLVRPPARFFADRESPPELLLQDQDAAHLLPLASPAELLSSRPDWETWQGLSRKSLARLAAWFLVAEDPQRRLDAQAVETLAHQASLVRHVLTNPRLDRVLIADEVGLGKTVEAGLIIRELLAARPALRVLYLAPARLVANVRREFDRLGLDFRSWVAGDQRDATLRDRRVLASIHRASIERNMTEFVAAEPWDVIVADECHHLSDYEPGGGKPGQQYKLVRDLLGRLRPDGRFLLMSGTPHQGHHAKFDNLIRLLLREGESESAVAGRIIYRTKDDIRGWDGHPLFPKRDVRTPRVIDIAARHRRWLERIHELYATTQRPDGSSRAAGWRSAQALQWATSSVQAGLGYLVRQAIRVGWRLERQELADALGAIRPYRLGATDEPLERLFARIEKEVARQVDVGDVDDIEDEDEIDRWRPDPLLLASLLWEGVAVLAEAADEKWRFIYDEILAGAGDEKVVLFAQPIETVTALAQYLARRTGRMPALIIGNQTDAERTAEVAQFWDPDGPQYLVSSRAGGEGLNLQVSRRLIHVDVPWNPMELEQRIGRVHRFGSRYKIIVETIVVRGSREEHAYRIARQKLADVMRSLSDSEERFEEMFARVMSRIPPSEFLEVCGERALAPLSEDEQRRIASMVTQGYRDWEDFHRNYGEERRAIASLDAGQATFDDLAAFARAHLAGREEDGFTSIRFAMEGEEVQDHTVAARVLRLRDGKAYAVSDHAGMPVTGPGRERAERLGLNVGVITETLRSAAFPGGACGAAHLGWRLEQQGIDGLPPRPFGVLVMARQSIRYGDAGPREIGVTLHTAVISSDGSRSTLDRVASGALCRALQGMVIRREPDAGVAEGLLRHVQRHEAEWNAELRRRLSEDVQTRTRHAVTPLIAAVIW